jgi:hypothetical protein
LALSDVSVEGFRHVTTLALHPTIERLNISEYRMAVEDKEGVERAWMSAARLGDRVKAIEDAVPVFPTVIAEIVAFMIGRSREDLVIK